MWRMRHMFKRMETVQLPCFNLGWTWFPYNFAKFPFPNAEYYCINKCMCVCVTLKVLNKLHERPENITTFRNKILILFSKNRINVFFNF